MPCRGRGSTGVVADTVAGPARPRQCPSVAECPGSLQPSETLAGLGHTDGTGRQAHAPIPGGVQVPLARRIPKRGFNNMRHGLRYLPVNVQALNEFEDGARVDEQAMRNAGLANGRADGVKILGTGKLTKKLVVSARAFSASARAQIESLGGTCEISNPAKSLAPASAPAPAPKS